MKIKYRVLFLLVMISFTSYGQEQVGIRSAPSSGVYSIFLNPAFSSRYPYEWHANLFAVHSFLQTDYAYISNANLFSALGNITDLDIVTRRNQIPEADNERRLVFDTDGGRKNIGIQGSVLWPAFIKSHSKNEKIGAYIQTRAAGSALRIPSILGYYEISEVRNDEAIIPDFSFSGLVWTELGTHYSKIVDQDSYESTALGINAKLVIPHEGGRFASIQEVMYRQQDSIYTAAGLVTSSGYNVFANDQGFKIRWNGIGLSTDLGYHYTTASHSYGISLLDLGFASISRNARNYDIVSDTSLVFNANSVADPDDIIGIIEEVDRQLETQVSRSVEEGGSYVVGLPTALSLQYARSLGKNVALSAQLIQRFPVFGNSLRRLNSLSVVPRYQKGWFSAAVPVTLYEYSDPRVGLALQYWLFFIGSDDVTSLLGSKNFSGTDLYFGIQWYPFDRAKKRSGVECFQF